jgi:DNA polymerase-3 subunit epsilon
MQLQLSLGVADRLHETLLIRGEPLDAVEAARMLIASPAAPAPLCQEILAALVHHDGRFCWDGGATSPLSLRQWEVPDPDLADVPFVALDLETTGARPGMSKITEIGAVRIEGFREVGYFSTLVNPLRPIPPMITRLTGITQDMVADAPRIESVVPELLEFLEGAVIVAHNAAFDVGFLNYELQRLKGRKLGEGAIDTLPLARALAPGLPNYRLHTVADALDAPVAACHRALADAQAAGHVFVTLAGRLQDHGITRLGELRAYVSPSSRSVMDKLRLTRDLPRCPGTYRFVGKDGHILYVGKADCLGERVRSHFVANADHARKVRQAVRLVERIDWDEACTPLEAVVDEQRLILEHRPSCNMYGTRPETYAYIKAGGGGGLSLFTSSRAPKWLDASCPLTRSPRQPLVMGPFRGRMRLHAAIELLQRCYPIRRCPQRPDGRPCVRADSSRCLAPCAGDPQTKIEHDALVLKIIGWLAGQADADLPDPLERADDVMRHLSRGRRHEEAQGVRDACEHLLSVRRSYASLAEARALRFAALWPQACNGDGPSVRLNLVCDGRLRDPVSLYPDRIEEGVVVALESLRSADRSRPADNTCSLVAEQTRKVPIPGPEDETATWEATRIRLVREAKSLLLSTGPPPVERGGSAV